RIYQPPLRTSAVAMVVCPRLSLEELARGVGERLAAERALDAQALVPFRHALGAREAAHLELRHAPADGEVDDRHVLGLARARRDDRPVAHRTGGLPAGQGFSYGADLVRFQKNCIARALSISQLRRASDKKIVTDDLDGSSFGERPHGLGVVLG